MSLRNTSTGQNSSDNRVSVQLANDQVEDLREKFLKVFFISKIAKKNLARSLDYG